MVRMRNRPVKLGALLVLLLGALCDPAAGQTAPPNAGAIVPYYAAPDAMELCGEPVPLRSQDVKERFDREFTIVVYSHAQVYLWLKRLERYFPWLEKQLVERKLPQDLKYVAVAESDLLMSANSPAGAVGPWQFISSTGSNYGLDQSRLIDERHDFEKATESAFKYLNDLHAQFGNWTLAIAAYNCGERRVHEEIQKQKVSDYYSLRLPLETERYILRILAIKEVLSHPERYGYSLPERAGYPPLKVDQVTLQLPNSLPIQVVAEAAGITYREFKVLNPTYISDVVPQGSQIVKVPEGKGKQLAGRLDAIKTSYKPRSVIYKVAKGDTLTGIAARYGVSTQDLRAWNQLKGDAVHPGQSLKILK